MGSSGPAGRRDDEKEWVRNLTRISVVQRIS